MSGTVIRVKNLGKKYTLGHQKEGEQKYKALRDVVADSAKSVGQRLLGKGRAEKDSQEDFWALKDVSFEIEQGDRVGIIGRNGAGKSTLLKILSRITEPTEGQIHIRGRVASLLEVGTGFYPELTGRENIYLNGAILGMSRLEIRQKFDEIVAFAEAEKVLDIPVKRYLSGMYARLVEISKGEEIIELEIEGIPLSPGMYSMLFGLTKGYCLKASSQIEDAIIEFPVFKILLFNDIEVIKN